MHSLVFRLAANASLRVLSSFALQGCARGSPLLLLVGGRGRSSLRGGFGTPLGLFSPRTERGGRSWFCAPDQAVARPPPRRVPSSCRKAALCSFHVRPGRIGAGRSVEAWNGRGRKAILVRFKELSLPGAAQLEPSRTEKPPGAKGAREPLPAPDLRAGEGGGGPPPAFAAPSQHQPRFFPVPDRPLSRRRWEAKLSGKSSGAGWQAPFRCRRPAVRRKAVTQHFVCVWGDPLPTPFSRIDSQRGRVCKELPPFAPLLLGRCPLQFL